MPVLDLPSALDARSFRLFRELIRERTGIWLRDGKEVMLAARLTRRLRHHGLTSFSDYYELVQTRDSLNQEIGELINCVTTNKTSFFREPHHFDFLSQTVVPAIQSAAARGGAKSISIWSAACSTGEEPYSIAVTLLKSMRSTPATSGAGWEIRVAASDVDTSVLQIAARAVYDVDALASIPAALRRNYFLRGKGPMEDCIRVKEAVTRLVSFQRINLMEATWPIHEPFDAIFFRNALIYFQKDIQDIFLRRMARLLKPQGYLFLGHSEHIPWLHDILEPLSKTTYRSRNSK